MKKQILKNLNISAVGMGCMGFSHGYGDLPSKEEAIDLIRYAYKKGCTFFDTAESYGSGHNEIIVGEALKSIREKVILATKLHIPENIDRPVYDVIKEQLISSLKRLQTDYVDLYYQHRVNKTISVEDVAEAMGKLIKEGLIKGWGQSQPTADEVRRGNAVTPMTAVQCEFSIMERSFEKEVIPLCKELGIGVVAFSPMASGFLSGKYNENTVYTGDDVRRVITRFKKENVIANQPLLNVLNKIAEKKGVTVAQISLAWIIYKGIIPIPGMRKIERINENLAAGDIELTPEEYNGIEKELSNITIYGNRTDEDISKLKTMLNK